jgi:hypothetical protein
MAKKKPPKMTPEELAQRAETSRMLEERIAYHETKAADAGEISREEAKRYLTLRAAAAAAAEKAGGAITREEETLRTENQRMLEERMAYHEEKAREDDARRGENR